MELLHKYPITGSAELPFARLTYHESISLIRLEFTHDLNFTITEVSKILELSKQLSGDNAFHMISIVDVNFKPDRDVYDFMVCEDRRKYVLSDTFVLPSSMLRILFNFYMRIKKPLRPTRAFKTEEDALKWLLISISA